MNDDYPINIFILHESKIMLNTYLTNIIPLLNINIVVVIMFTTITIIMICSNAIREKKMVFLWQASQL